MQIGIVGEAAATPQTFGAQLTAAGHAVIQLTPPAASTLVSLGLDALLVSTQVVDASSISLCRELRAVGYQTALVIVAGEFVADHAQRAFAAGCDDYFVTPVRCDALLARLAILALRQSTTPAPSADVLVGPLRIDGYDRVLVGQEHHKMPAKERALLRRLARTPGELVSHAQLIAAGWGPERLGSNALEVHVSRLRRWLNCTLGFGVLEIRAVRGAGYLLASSQPKGKLTLVQPDELAGHAPRELDAALMTQRRLRK